MIQRARRIDRLFSPHEKVFIHNVMPEQGLEDLLKLVQNLSRKIETIEDAIALDAPVLGGDRSEGTGQGNAATG